MKLRILLLALLLISCNFIFCQKITINELQQFCTNNWENTNKYLLTKGWDFNASNTGDSENYEEINWSFKKNLYNNKANGWVHVFTYENKPSKVLYKISNKNIYQSLLTQLKTNNFKLTEEKILFDNVTATYSNLNYYLKISYQKENHDDTDNYYNNRQTNNFTVYLVTLYKKGGFDDPNNGYKKDYDYNGNLESEYVVKDGLLNGVYKSYYNGNLLKNVSYFKNGIENGERIEYNYEEIISESDTLVEEENIETDSTSYNNLENYATYNPNKFIKTTGQVSNDNKTGIWNIFLNENNTSKHIGEITYLNDKLDGLSTTYNKGKVVITNYKENLIHGKFKEFTTKTNELYPNIQKDTLNFIKILESNYTNNKLDGKYLEFTKYGKLATSGFYKDSLKTGKWDNYYPEFENEYNSLNIYSNLKYKQSTFFQNKLNGESKSYYFLEKQTNPNCNKTEKEACLTYTIRKIFETENYLNDELNGEYILRDENNNLLKKGTYLLNKKNGEWEIYNTSIYSFWFNKQTFEKGFYDNDKRIGEWKRSDLDGNLLEKYNYENNYINGKHITYSNLVPTEFKYFKSGTFYKYEKTDNSLNIIASLQITNQNSDFFECEKKETTNNGIQTENFVVTKSNCTINPISFPLDIESAKKTLNGIYQFTNLNNEITENGQYQNNNKIGSWTKIYADQKIKTIFEYNEYGIIIDENYFDIKKNEPLNDEFIYNVLVNKTIEERRIRNGKRNGNTKIKNSEGKTLRKESYKDGILEIE